ncbi:serine/arginine repetitive matrix 1 [Burkholderia pseudomallei]|uniref:serine/arginine repetitive matrix 1 n=1 Tax=Burkholderia pseudomallei TaxID=28450 RepID=UPI000BA8015F|nr:serine/arginine repetitive matrix 1 [Burkholderia pseudomallei]
MVRGPACPLRRRGDAPHRQDFDASPFGFVFGFVFGFGFGFGFVFVFVFVFGFIFGFGFARTSRMADPAALCSSAQRRAPRVTRHARAPHRHVARQCPIVAAAPRFGRVSHISPASSTHVTLAM